MKPFAWAYRKGDDKLAEISTNRAWHYGMRREFGGEVIPLYRSPALTPAEREAVEWASRAADPDCTGHIATLRGLLDRIDATGSE